MNPILELLSDRSQQAQKIIKNPSGFKVCEGCGSIVVMKSVSCPNCHAYCFDSETKRVLRQAKVLAKRAARSVLFSDLI